MRTFAPAVHRMAVAGTRFVLGAIFFTSGMGKLTHGDFVGLIGPVWLEERLAPHGLALWATFVAWSQLAIGLLLLSQRFATLGAVMLVPMLANILVITISLEWRGTPYVNAALLAMNLFLLVADRRRLLPLLTAGDPVAPAPRKTPAAVSGDGAALVAIALGIAGALLHPLHRYAAFACAGVAAAFFLIRAFRDAFVRPARASG